MQDQILIIDNHKIQIFTSDGEFISKFGSKGKNPGEFNWPKSVITNSNDQILVTDYNNNRIQIFNSHGLFVKEFYNHYPFTIAINSIDHIFIINYTNTISVYDNE